MKLIQVTVEGCADCPYSHFDHGSKERDSGWDCKLANKRIVDEGDHWDFSESEKGEPGEPLPTHLEGVMKACEIHLFPDWCPLPEIE